MLLCEHGLRACELWGASCPVCGGRFPAVSLSAELPVSLSAELPHPVLHWSLSSVRLKDEQPQHPLFKFAFLPLLVTDHPCVFISLF